MIIIPIGCTPTVLYLEILSYPKTFPQPIIYFKYIFTDCVRQNNAPKDVQVLIPRTYVYVSLYGKRDFAAMIKLRTLG